MTEHDQTLPELSDERIAELEEQLFAEIRAEQRSGVDAQALRRRRMRGRLWLAGGAAAAVVVVAAVVAPLVNLGPAGSAVDGASAPEFAPHSAPDGGGTAGEDLSGADADDAASSADEAGSAREIIATASASVRVDDARDGAAQITALAEDAGGYVEALSVGAAGDRVFEAERGDLIAPTPQTATWLTVRVPATRLQEVIDALAEVGEVTASQLDRRDVTGEAVDLRARIDALRTSVQRLESLMADASSTADLLAAESALAERQAQLESYEQQLKRLEDQVGMSALTVSLYEPSQVVEADPAGFGDGIVAGWNGLVATLNGVVIGVGFLLPWLGVLAVLGVIAWLIRRAVRRRPREE
ncbi:MAG: DUF4349 domain-containing protein [Candidatus Cloacimonetes bacterium]|nr:DUF4349 domain-containing protein [Candidatus Cloacimonadota bacterium]